MNLNRIKELSGQSLKEDTPFLQINFKKDLEKIKLAKIKLKILKEKVDTSL